VGSVRRECLDHVILLGERHLGGILKSYFAYYHRSRTHLSLSKDAPEPREVCPPAMGKIVELPEVGGLQRIVTAALLLKSGVRRHQSTMMIGSAMRKQLASGNTQRMTLYQNCGTS